MGGTKRKIEIEEIERSDSKSVTFTKRRDGLFSKASALCRISPGTQIAIIATPVSSNSHASFYTFGHSSVDHVVSSLLHDHSPALRTNYLENRPGLGFWWEDEGFDRSENVEELKNAVDAVSSMLNNVRLRLDDAVKSKQIDEGLDVFHQEEEEEVPNQLRNEEMINQITKFVGETSGSENNLFESEDLFTDVNIDPF